MAGSAEGLGREIVLGLLIERPGSGYQLEKRLRERFGSCNYAEGTARQTLGRLHELGFARPAAPSRPLRSREARMWEATPAGVATFRAWVRESVSTSPVREELHAKIALCQPQDLPRLIDVVREAERVCVFQLQAMNRQLQERRELQDPRKRQERRERLDGGEWAAGMDLIVAAAERAWWDSRIKWLQGVRVYLEQELVAHPPSAHPRFSASPHTASAEAASANPSAVHPSAEHRPPR